MHFLRIQDATDENATLTCIQISTLLHVIMRGLLDDIEVEIVYVDDSRVFRTAQLLLLFLHLHIEGGQVEGFD